MCGIVGTLNFVGDQVSSENLQNGLRTLSHRGPDASKVWFGQGVGLGHSRLSIVDTDERSDQPMCTPNNKVIVFNGEIYNHYELRNQLKHNYNFITLSDTEVILAAYEAWGERCVERFIGDWAFAIYDLSTQKLFLSRDRLGVKPLYYHQDHTSFKFASEVKALWEMDVSAEMTTPNLLMMLKNAKSELDDQTPFANVKTLMPGHNMTICPRQGISMYEYWGEEQLFNTYRSPKNIGEAQEQFYSLLNDSVQLRLQADVPVGVALSGGLDSSLLSALAVRTSDSRIQTFSGISPGYSSDESLYSDMVAAQIGSKHTTVDLGNKNIFDIIERYVYVQESSTRSMNSIARYYLLEEASKSVKVILDGQGGDELLCGYLRFNKIYNKAFGGNLEEKKVVSGNRLNDFKEVRVDFIQDQLPRKAYQPCPDSKVDPVTRALYQSLRGSGLLSLLHTEDRLTMSHGMEGRVPYLDHRLVELCFSCPIEMKIGDVTKLLLRRVAVMNGLLPHRVIGRKDKKGFASPYSEKFSRDSKFRSNMREFVLDNTSKYKQIFDSDVINNMFLDKSIDYSSRLMQIATTAVLLSKFNINVK